MLLVVINIALISAVVFYFLNHIKKSLIKDLNQLISLFVRNDKAPPGPRGLPFLGYLPFLAGRDPYTAFSQLAKDYGGMAFARLGKKNILVLREPDMIREAYKTVAFSDRPNSSLKNDDVIGNKGIIQACGDVWMDHRRLILAAFRDLGLKTASSDTPQSRQVAELIQRDVEEYLKCIDESVVGRLDGHLMLERLTGRLAGSAISSCVFGMKKSFNDELFAENVALIEEGFQVGEAIAPFEFLPVLKKIPGWWDKVEKKVKSNYCRTCKYHGGLIKEKLAECDASHPDSLITIYRNEIDKRGNCNEKSVLSEHQLTQTMTDLFCAGTETVKYSLLWAMLYMAEYPQVQLKIQAEIDALAENQPVKWEDLPKCPYTEATICEVLRMRPVLPFGHPRAIHQYGAEFRGKSLPKETVVLSLIWDVHLDEKYWENPNEFKPDRFLNADGKVSRPENFMPFGAGRRVCIGDQMTMMEMFITFAAILKRFNIVPKVDQDTCFDWKILLSLLVPQNFNVDLVPRG